MAAENRKLDDFLVKNAPPCIYYIPNFITKADEEYLIRQVYAAPKPKWTQLSHRRLQNWGGLPHEKGMVAETIPKWLEVYMEKISRLGAFEDKKPNHVLVNEYLVGQGIMPHEDGPLFYPTVSTISLGSHTLLDFYGHIAGEGDRPDRDTHSQEEEASSFESRYITSVLLEPRSLVLIKESMYTNYLHGIAERSEDSVTESVANLDCLGENIQLGSILKRQTRISLTIRHFPKVVKVKLKLGSR